MIKNQIKMSRAEEKAQAVYPAWRNGIGDEFNSNSAYYGFIEGYQQAEKDLELTWEDIKEICVQSVLVEVDLGGLVSDERHYTEVLKRFKERKEK